MQTTILNYLNEYGYLAIFLLILLETIFPPIPSELILTFSGFLTIYGSLNFTLVLVIATLGSVLGALMLYQIGYVIGKERLMSLLDSQLARRLHLKPTDIQKAEQCFLRFGWQAVFFGRCVPIVRSLISIPAGLAKMNVYLFILLTSLGTLLWNFGLIYLGRLAGNAWIDILGYFESYATITLGLGLIVGCVGLGFFIRKRFFIKNT